jgi:type IV secretion system protein VirD4
VAYTREAASVLSSVQKTLGFLDSKLVAASVARSTFDVRDLLKPGTTLFLQVPPEQLLAARGLLRCWLSTVIRVIGSAGDERRAKVLGLIDEASAVAGLPALEEVVVRGRSAGVRLLLAMQSDSQVRAFFKDKPTLLYDNCSTHIHLGGADSIEGAERIAKGLGDWTQLVESYSANESTSRQSGGADSQGSTQVSWNRGRSWQPQGRALMRPEEILTMSRQYLIAFIAGMAPIRARRVLWYADSLFGTVPAFYRLHSLLWWALLAAALCSIGWGLLGGK